MNKFVKRFSQPLPVLIHVYIKSKPLFIWWSTSGDCVNEYFMNMVAHGVTCNTVKCNVKKIHDVYSKRKLC